MPKIKIYRSHVPLESRASFSFGGSYQFKLFKEFLCIWRNQRTWQWQGTVSKRKKLSNIHKNLSIMLLNRQDMLSTYRQKVLLCALN